MEYGATKDYNRLKNNNGPWGQTGYKMKNLIVMATVLFGAWVAQAAVQDWAPVTTVVVDGQTLLADRNHMTAYVFDVDTANTSNCYNGCAKAWPPVLVQAGEKVQAPFGVTARKDGTQQLTFNSRPIYLYEGDEASGDINGDGLNNVWHIIPVQ